MPYIDPGSGALVFQAIAAAILGAGVTFRRNLRRALERAGLVSPPEPDPDDPTDAG